jgi:hypothetical protein
VNPTAAVILAAFAFIALLGQRISNRIQGDQS